MKIGVIGAGPAGITAAYQLAKSGAEVEVFEASDAVGGMSRSLTMWDQIVDLGPHRFFSGDDRVNELWLEVVGDDYEMVRRLTRIMYGKRFFNYPLEPLNALKNLGPFEAARCIGSYFKENVMPSFSETDSFESWVVRRFGRHLFEIFFKTYSEKLWGITCQELSADFAAQRIKKLSLGEAIKNSLGFAKGKHRTLTDAFAYPVEGTGMVYDRMAEAVQAVGEVHTGRPVRRVLCDGHQVEGLELISGEIVRCDHVISTMPLNLMVKGLDATPDHVHKAASALTFRNTILVYLLVDGTDLFPDQWIYVHSPNLDVGRVTNFRNWVPQLYGSSNQSILSLEYWCYDRDEAWQAPDEQLIAKGKQEIIESGLIGDAEVLEGKVIKIRRCYPVYAQNYQQHLDVVTQHLNQFSGLTPIGRYGAFKYNNQDHSILMGMLAADKILENRQCDLWSVNTDYASYQEAAKVAETQLEQAAT